MRIIKLTLENFQGIKSAVIDFNGRSAAIYGENATGKTTIQNAHCWLLFGRAGDGAKGYTPKTSDADGGYLHNLEHSVEETIQFDNGRIITLRRVYREVYKKKRGSAQESFDGNTINYYINGVPSQEKEYNEEIAKLAGGDIERLKILTMPVYFPSELPWQARRTILLDLCGDITDDDVINSTKGLNELPEYLRVPGTECEKYSIDDYRKIATAKKTDINTRLKTIPARIDEAERATPNTSSYTRDSVQSDLSTYRATKEALESERAESKAPDTATQEARKARQKAESDLNEARNRYLEDINRKNAEIQNKTRDLVESASLIDRDITTNKSRISEAQVKVKQIEELRQQFLFEYETFSKQVWNPDNSVCPACNRQLPDEDIKKLREEFNLNKSKKLEIIQNRGKNEASQNMITEMQNSISNAQIIIENLTAKYKDLAQQIDEIRASYIKTPFEDTEEYKALSEAVTSFRKAESEAGTSPNPSDKEAALIIKISAVIEKIRDCETKLMNLEIRRKQLERMTELQAEEKRLSAEYENLDTGTFLCEAFIRQKVKLLTDNINSRFNSVRFRLFVDQINGGLREDCEVMIPSPDGNLVPYSTANGAAKINGGIEIINVLSQVWGINVPLFIDDAERVTHLLDTDTQTIKLIVSERDKALRTELVA